MEVPEVLAVDDACLSAGSGDSGCAVHALQTKVESAAVESNKQHGVAASHTTNIATSNHTNCFGVGKYYHPNMNSVDNMDRLVTSSEYHCQAVCKATVGCVTFSWWPDHGCQLQATGAELVTVTNQNYAAVIYGPAACPNEPPMDVQPLVASAFLCISNPTLACCKCGACCIPYCDQNAQEFKVLDGCGYRTGGYCTGLSLTGPPSCTV